MDKRTIIGIDPGTNLLGFGVIDVIGGKPVFVDMGVLDLRKEKDAYSKLRQIYDTVSEVCKTYHGTDDEKTRIAQVNKVLQSWKV